MPESNASPSSGRGVVYGAGFACPGIVSLGLGLYYENLEAVVLGAVLIAVGLAIYSVATVRGSDRRMRAIANLVFHEKIAIIGSYMGKQQKQIEHDRQAAVELGEWVEPRLKKEFEELWHEFFEQGTKPIVIKIGGSTLWKRTSSSDSERTNEITASALRSCLTSACAGSGS